MPAAVAPQWRDRRRQVFQSVFQADVSLPTPQATPSSFAGAIPPPSFLQQLSRQQQSLHARGHTLAPPGGGLRASSRRTATPEPPPLQAAAAAHPRFPPAPAPAADDQQATYDRAWHVVTAHIALPPSATADDSFGSLVAAGAESSPQTQQQQLSADFHEAFALLVNAGSLLPRAARTGDILAWHVRQARAHFAQHVVPLLAGCVEDVRVKGDEWEEDEEEGEAGRRRRRRRGGGGGGRAEKGAGNSYERHMVVVMSSIRTLEAALRLYFYGLGQLLSGFARLADTSPEAAKDVELLNARFRRDIHALVSNSVSEGLMTSVESVLARLAGTILGIPPGDTGQSRRPASPGPDDLQVQAARERLLELVQQLHNVGLAGERFQVLFAEVMDAMMSAFVTGAYAGVWSAPDTHSLSATMETVSRNASFAGASSRCIMSLHDWVENHFARLSCEVLACVAAKPQGGGPLPVSLADLKTYQLLALGRLAALRIHELFDIVLAWPASRPALDDLRATITTAARRRQLTDSFARALQTRLLHPGCSTLEILQTYIAIIRTLHALDPSKVLLSHVEPSLQLYLCHREDAVRVVVAGLLASPAEIRAARMADEGLKGKRERYELLRDSDRQTRQRTAKDHGPFTTPNARGGLSRSGIDKPRRDSNSEAEEALEHGTATPTDVHPQRPTTLVELALLLNDPSQTRRAAPEVDDDLDWNDMNWMPDPVDAGANYKRPKREDVIGTLISALGSEDVFIKEFQAVVAGRLLGEPARFDQELRVLDLLKRRFGEAALQSCDVMIRDVQDSRRVDAAIRRARGGTAGALRRRVLSSPEPGEAGDGAMDYHARILSRLFWPGLDTEHFLLPEPVVNQQRQYEQGYERLKSGRKLTWLNHLGQAKVELELKDRTVAVDCSTVEATVIYAFQDGGGGGEASSPAQKSVDELYMQLQLDEDLITAALHFWVGKGVLRRAADSNTTYVVAETLHDPTTTTTTATITTTTATSTTTTDPTAPSTASEPPTATASTTAASNKPRMTAKERERREVYWRYVQGMLTNASASMPLAQMAMMLKMLIPEGFPWGNEELQEFLGERVAAGEMEVVGGKYRLRK